MLTITTDRSVQTVILTYDVTPGTFLDVLEKLTAAYHDFICKQPGFIASAIHVNDAQTRIASYSQWRSRDDFQAVLRSGEMRATNQELSDLSKSFVPVMYEVTEIIRRKK
jgi:heme-degrading monooxygenase HmoA